MVQNGRFFCKKPIFYRIFTHKRQKKAVEGLTAAGKTWYNNTMDTINTDLINERIARNLVYYRKAAGFTQAELAQKINYSDKSVSKWESANGVPDIYILLKLADLYGVTVNDLVSEEVKAPVLSQKPSRLNTSLVMILSSGIVWLVATVFFVLMNIFFSGKEWWLTFLFAVPVTAIVVLVLSAVFKRRATNFFSLSILIWSAIVCVYVTASVVMNNLGHTDKGGLWMVFLLGIPLQLLQVFWTFFRGVSKKAKMKNARIHKA